MACDRRNKPALWSLLLLVAVVIVLSALPVAAEDADPTSHLSLYRAALAERRRNPALGDGGLAWCDGFPPQLIAFDREPGFRCLVNFGEPVDLPEGVTVLVHSGDPASGRVGTDEAVWLAR